MCEMHYCRMIIRTIVQLYQRPQTKFLTIQQYSAFSLSVSLCSF